VKSPVNNVLSWLHGRRFLVFLFLLHFPECEVIIT
jgi:hypothetical protein